LVKRVEAGEVTWLLEAAERRVFATVRGGGELVTTAPNEDALRRLVDRVDPKRERLVATWQHREHREVPWADIPKLLDRYLVYTVQQNQGRRVLLTTMTKDMKLGPSFVTLQPHHGDIEGLLPRKHGSGLYVKRFDWREITWPEAKRLMTEHEVSVSLAHVGRVIIRVQRSAGPEYLTIEPETNVAAYWLEANKPGSILTIE
jgi:hypothetical protein